MTAPGQTMVRESEIMAPARVDMKQFLARLSTDEQFKEQQELSAAYDRACRALIGPNDVQIEGDREFKKKSAWRKLQRYFSISTAVVNVIEKFVTGDEGESIHIAVVTVRAMAPWGQYAEAVGACATDEESGQRVITIADALATAETRATNRSVSNLIAMGEVSAEELSKGNGSANGSSNGNADMKRAEKPAGDFRIPFGPSKNTKLSEMELSDLEGAYDWAVEKKKFPDFQKAAKAEMANRKNPPAVLHPDDPRRKENQAKTDGASQAPAAAGEPVTAPAAATPAASTSTSHKMPPGGKVADALDSTSRLVLYDRIKAALRSTAITLEVRNAYADANRNLFKGKNRQTIEWWAKYLEDLAANETSSVDFDPDNDPDNADAPLDPEFP